MTDTRRTERSPWFLRGRILALAALCVLGPRGALAEETASRAERRSGGPRGHFALLGLAAEPFGTGSHAVGRWGYGLGFSLGGGYGSIPLTVGVDFLAVAWSTGSTRDLVLFQGNEVDAQITRRDRTIFYDAWLRLEPPFFTVRPYLEGVVGVKGLYTESSLRLSDGTGETRATTHEQAASTLGFGAGVDVQVARNAMGAVAYASVGFRRLQGGRAALSGAFDTGDTARFEVSTSTTLVLAGIVARW